MVRKETIPISSINKNSPTIRAEAPKNNGETKLKVLGVEESNIKQRPLVHPTHKTQNNSKSREPADKTIDKRDNMDKTKASVQEETSSTKEVKTQLPNSSSLTRLICSRWMSQS